MAGYSGRLLYDGPDELRSALVGEAIHLANRQRAGMSSLGVSSTVRAYSLSGEFLCTIAETQHMRAIHIHAIASAEALLSAEDSIESTFTCGVHDIFSGTVDGVIQDEVIDLPDPKNRQKTLKVTVPALRAVFPTQRNAQRNPPLYSRRKLAVDEHSKFAVSGMTNRRYSEHLHVASSRYSGAMRQVVQLLLGVGYVILPNAEQRWIKDKKGRALLSDTLTDTTTLKSGAVSSGFDLYGALKTDVIGQQPPLTQKGEQTPVKLSYNYRFGETNGIVFATDGTPWVVDISPLGVFAMKLYLDPVSRTVEGAKRYLDVSPELTDFFTQFGGFPLGVPFPNGNIRAEWVRAGEALALLNASEMSDFYLNHAYASDIGWCFNTRGSEAHNTCYGYDRAGRKISIGYHFSLRFKISADQPFQDSPAGRTLAGRAKGTGLHRVNKARRMQQSDAEAILHTMKKDPDAAWKAFDDATVDPNTVATARLNLLRQGKLFHPSPLIQHNPGMPTPDWTSHPQIKFPETLIGGLISFNFCAEIGANIEISSGVSCDTPMFVMFNGDQLEVVYYQYNYVPDKPAPPPSSTRQPCQVSGSWSTSTPSGVVTQNGHFYSTSTDWRTSYASVENTSETTASLLGTYNHAKCAWPDRCVFVTASTAFRNVSDTVIEGNKYRMISVTIPFNDRCCYYMAQFTHALTGKMTSHSEGNVEYDGGITHLYELSNRTYHWLHSCSQGKGNGTCVAKLVGTFPDDGTNCVPLAPSPMVYSVCTDWIANKDIASGPWGNFGIGMATWPPYYPPAEVREAGDGMMGAANADIQMMNGSGFGNLTTLRTSAAGKLPDGRLAGFESLNLSFWWFTPSPTYLGEYAQLSVSNSCLGTPLMNYPDDFDGKTLHKGGPSEFYGADSTSYIGVIE